MATKRLEHRSPRWHGLSRLAKRSLRAWLPDSGVALLRWAWRRNPARAHRRFVSRQRHRRIRRTFFAVEPVSVLSGPFAGLRYPARSTGSAYWPKVLGTYESALQPVVERLVRLEPKLVIDIGCAEGYYAVGMARRLQESYVVASDLDVSARRMCTQLAEDNGVADRVFVVGPLRVPALHALLQRHAVLIIDAEGAEIDILDPTRLAGLRHTTVLVELHDFLDRSISGRIRDRFVGTHHWELLDERLPATEHLDEPLSSLSPSDREHALSEYRPETMQWALLTPRAV